jgi:hypothetical protein
MSWRFMGGGREDETCVARPIVANLKDIKVDKRGVLMNVGCLAPISNSLPLFLILMKLVCTLVDVCRCVRVCVSVGGCE